MKKYFLTVLVVFLLSHSGFSQLQKPNIIVILSDDAGYDDFETYGGEEIPTPHINTLTQEGVLFTNAYVTASVCAPSRTGLLTGRYQQRFGFEHNMSGSPAKRFTKADMGLDKKQKTIADYLKADGYKTIAIGKWHQGNTGEFFPLKRGFDEFYGFKEGQRNFFKYPNEREDEYALYDNDKIVPEEKITYTTDLFTNKAVSFIQQNKANPFFIYLAYSAVHTPMQAKESDLARFPDIKDETRRTYAAMMASLDDGIGKVMNALKANGIDDNTIVFFLNDNGGATNNASNNGRLRGMKGSKWEGGIRVGFTMRWPVRILPNSTYNQPISSLDILPTAITATGSGISFETDRVNLLLYLKNKKTPHKDLFWRRGVAAAVRSGKWKLIRVNSNPTLLFNLNKDISETKNLANKRPRKVKRLLAKIQNWEKKLEVPRWGRSAGGQNQIMKHRMNVVGRDMERKYP